MNYLRSEKGNVMLLFVIFFFRQFCQDGGAGGGVGYLPRTGTVHRIPFTSGRSRHQRKPKKKISIMLQESKKKMVVLS